MSCGNPLAKTGALSGAEKAEDASLLEVTAMVCTPKDTPQWCVFWSCSEGHRLTQAATNRLNHSLPRARVSLVLNRFGDVAPYALAQFLHQNTANPEAQILGNLTTSELAVSASIESVQV